MANPKSKRPYLLRALYDWIVDSGFTPHILVAADDASVRVPAQHVRDGKIVLNVSPSAVRDLVIQDHMVSFDGRFSGTPYFVEVPMARVEAIYAKESGEGMMFEAESESSDSPARSGSAKADADPPQDSAGACHLKVIK